MLFNVCSSIFLASGRLHNGVQLSLRLGKTPLTWAGARQKKRSSECVGVFCLQEGRFQSDTALYPVTAVIAGMFCFQKEESFDEQRSWIPDQSGAEEGSISF